MKIIRVGQIRNMQLDVRNIDLNDTQNSIDQLVQGVQTIIDAASRFDAAGLGVDLPSLVNEAIMTGNTSKLESLNDEVRSFQEIQTRMMGMSLFGSTEGNQNDQQKISTKISPKEEKQEKQENN